MKPTRTQILFLLNLAFSGEEPPQSTLDPKARRPLLEQGLIRLERRGRAHHVILTEAGWRWVEEHLDVPLAGRTSPETRVLRAILPRLAAFMAEREIPIAEIATARRPDAPLPDRIARAYLEMTRGRWQRRVHITALRSALPDVKRAELDHALLDIQKSARGALYPLDNPREITAADVRDALDIAGVHHHVLYMEA